MATCDLCKQDMLKAKACKGDRMVRFPDGARLAVIPHDPDADGPCGDCGVAPGGVHHSGCDMERCPRCQGQLISCACFEAEAA